VGVEVPVNVKFMLARIFDKFKDTAAESLHVMRRTGGAVR
jgi:hypothetical protein